MIINDLIAERMGGIPAITQETVDAMAKHLKQKKSWWYKWKLNRKYVKLDKKINKCKDSIAKSKLLLEQMKLLDTGLIYAKNMRSGK